MSGFRASVLIAGVLLVGAAAYTWWRGPAAESVAASATAPAEGLDAAAAEGDLAIEPSVNAAR